ncbi:probable ethanolamine kinase [Sycon ciliatum]|uniref:probable ethanolamine kinase n=1 Tax=Sycon ciliatum TaxID=27933 RepID=UPI0020AB256E|eukprot:scpid40002/ scgid35167/ Probable ethanolamine kinase
MACPNLSVKVDRTRAAEGAVDLVKRIKPDWCKPGLELVTKTFTDGITNVLVGVKRKGDDEKEMLLVRVHGNNTELIIDREREIRTIRMLEQKGCSPPLYCTFENGICYGFVPGQPVSLSSVRDPSVVPLVVKAMVKFHSVAGLGDGEEPVLFNTMESWLKLLPTDGGLDDNKQKRYLELCAKVDIERELGLLKERLLQLRVPVVFCHNDLLLGNVIHNRTDDSVAFIDFEYGGLNYRSYDIANHFCEYPGTENVDYKHYPGREHQLDFIRLYLEETARLKGGEAPVTIPTADVERMYVEVNQFTLASHMFWGIWAVIQAVYSEIDFDYIGYAHTRFDEYLRRKDEFLSLSTSP